MCCNDPSMQCYEKDPYWASCKQSCTPGIDSNDPIEYQTPWTCTLLGSSPPNGPPTPRPIASTLLPTPRPTRSPTFAPTRSPTFAPTLPPTVAPTVPSMCKQWCDANARDWSRKCNWNNCRGCLPCGNLPTLAPTQPLSGGGKCFTNFCEGNKRDWPKKCSWDSCRACSSCERPPTLAPTEPPSEPGTTQPPQDDSNCVAEWGACTGGKCCKGNSICKFSNEWYSQCLPADQ